MVELIVGKKGKGKTKVLLDRVNNAVKEANGSIVYLDKSTKEKEVLQRMSRCKKRIPKKGGKEDGRPWKHFAGK